jgi:N-acetylglucosamine-6-sulfatase
MRLAQPAASAADGLYTFESVLVEVWHLQSVFDRFPTRHWRRLIAAALLAGASLGLAGCGGDEGSAQFGISLLPSSVSARPRLATTPRRPNIVFVLTDDLSMDLLRFMPHVRAMESHGLTFRDYFVSDSLCCPSRASIFTGRYPHNTHVLDNTGHNGGFRAFYHRREELHTFALALQRSGYLTALMGKYLNGYLQGGKLGKHDGAAADVPPAYVPPGWNEWSVAGWGYPEFNYQLNQGGALYRFGHQPADYLTDVLAEKGVQFINEAAQRHRPFFLELATFAPHFPYVPAPRDRHDFPGLKAPRPPNFDRTPTGAPLWLSHHAPLRAHQLAVINKVFRRRAQAVQAVDRMIAEVESTLRSNGLTNNTYVIFSSDNGLHTGEYRLMPGKLTAFDTDIHVPLVVTGPGVRPGSSTTDVAENVDLAKTFTAIGGARMRGDGRSLLPLWHGHAPADWRNAALIEHHSPLITTLDPDFQQPASGRPTTYEAMRTHGYLYVEYADGELEFYDLRSDPFELHNIISSLTPSQLSLLHSELRSMEHCHGAAYWAATHVAPLPGPW